MLIGVDARAKLDDLVIGRMDESLGPSAKLDQLDYHLGLMLP